MLLVLQVLSACFVTAILPVLALYLLPLLTPSGKPKARKGKSPSPTKKTPTVKVSGWLLNWMLAFAAGALIGDSFLHMLASETQHRSSMSPVVTGIVTFFIVDKLVRCHTSLAHTGNAHGHHHNGSGFVPLLADAMHNFTDGLAIAASFSVSTWHGISTTVAIFAHEIPHELGDYAMLAKAGIEHARIVVLQLWTALAAFAGAIIGLYMQADAASLAGSAATSGAGMTGFAAGGFIYLAMTGIIPEVLESAACIGEIVCMLAGLALMYVLE